MRTDITSGSPPSDNLFTHKNGAYPNRLGANQALHYILLERRLSPKELMRACADFCELHGSLAFPSEDSYWEKVWDMTPVPAFCIFVISEVLKVDPGHLLGNAQLRQVIDTQNRLAATLDLTHDVRAEGVVSLTGFVFRESPPGYYYPLNIITEPNNK